MVDSKPLETQGAELPAIIQNIIQAKADELKALIGTDISTLPQLLALIAQETCRAREDLDAYIATYLQKIHDKLDNGEDLTEKEFNFVFRKRRKKKKLLKKRRKKRRRSN